MKQFPEIDYEYRPASYWTDEDVLSALLRDVKGSNRRKMIIHRWRQGRIDELSDQIKAASPTPGVQQILERVHPSFMGGEYLPDLRRQETEIARIELESTTADVISIRARRVGSRFAYSIVDEYNTAFDLPRKTSTRPLRMRQLIELLDGSSPDPDDPDGLPLCYNEMNAVSGNRSDLQFFTTITSTIYRDLERHYDHVFAEWSNPQRLEIESLADD